MTFKQVADQEEIRAESSPMSAATMGRDQRRKLRSCWETVKIEVMRNVVLAKFSQHGELKRLLLETGTAKLVEHTKNDSFWADGGDGSCDNLLGKKSEEVRTLLKQVIT